MKTEKEKKKSVSFHKPVCIAFIINGTNSGVPGVSSAQKPLEMSVTQIYRSCV